MNIVIAGFGVGGFTAAEVARKHNPKAYITIFSKEKDLFYYRMRLPEVVSGKLAPEKIIAHPQQWFDERNIEVRLGESLAEIYIKEKIIRGSIGSRQPYDRLLLAVGAEANRPAFPGDGLDNIFTLRSLNEAWSIFYATENKKKAVLIGGGLLGLEIGYALVKRGLEVTVLERGERILPNQTTPASATLLGNQLADIGLKIKLGVEVDRFEGHHQVDNVVLKDGSDLPTDLVIISAGVAPQLNLALALSLEVDRAIVVDKYLETSQPHIYAVGDCVQFPGAACGLWATAREQALVAGINISEQNPDERKSYEPIPPASILKVAGIDLMAAGNLDPDGQLQGFEFAGDNFYRKLVLNDNNNLVGFTNVGTTQGNKELGTVLAAKECIDPEVAQSLVGPDCNFSCLK